MARIFVFRMRDGRRTTDVEQALEWLGEVSIVTPEFAQQMRKDAAAARMMICSEPGQQSSGGKGSWK